MRAPGRNMYRLGWLKLDEFTAHLHAGPYIAVAWPGVSSYVLQEMKSYRIATIPGDGIGQEVVPEGISRPEYGRP
jgi:hypothetical protein